MSVIVSNYSNFVTAGATATLVSGAGQIHQIIASNNNATGETITFYDNTAASGNVLLQLRLSVYSGLFFIRCDSRMPLIFSTGLTVVCGANSCCHVTTEE